MPNPKWLYAGQLVFILFISGFLLTARADTITQISSAATTTTNNSTDLGIPNAGPTQNIIGNAFWSAPLAGSSWVSFANTGDTSKPGSYTVPNGTAVTFSQAFDLFGTITDATLTVLADDTISVILNGTTILPANLGGSYPLCSSIPIGCQSSTEGNFNLSQLQPYLNSNGANTISFTVYQENGETYGLDYAGSITTVPEPGALLLLSCGLGILALGSCVRLGRVGVPRLRKGRGPTPKIFSCGRPLAQS
jgi:hypothetical protein